MMEEKPDIMSIMEREGLKLRRAGQSYRGKCPKHDGKSSGSFSVNPSKQVWHCFGCNEGGDVIGFIMWLHGFSFKDACVYLGITPGRPVPVDPAIQRRREIQRNYEKAITSIYNELCDRAQYLHRLRLQVKNHPGALTDAGAVLFAEQMGELSEVDYKLDVLLTGTFEDQILILKGMRRNEATTISRAA